MTELYRARRGVWKVRAMMWLSLVVAVWFCLWGWDLFQTYGTRPADGGVLAPLGVRLAWLLFLPALGLAFLAGMWLYGGLYVTALLVDEPAGKLHVRTIGFIGSLGGRRETYALVDVVGTDFNEGKLDNPGGVSVDASWFSLRIRGRKWPLIVDAQGSLLDREVAARVLRLGKAPAPDRRPGQGRRVAGSRQPR